MNNKYLLEKLLQANSHIISKEGVNNLTNPLLLGHSSSNFFVDLTKVFPSIKKSLRLVREVFRNKGDVVLILNEGISRPLENLAGHFFIIIKNSWPEGSVSNFSTVKKTCYKFNKKLKQNNLRSNKGSDKKELNQASKFFRRYKSVGFLKNRPRLVISLLPANNPLFLRELGSFNIPLISFSGKVEAQHPDFAITLNTNNNFLNNFILKLLILEAKKGKKELVKKYKSRKSFHRPLLK